MKRQRYTYCCDNFDLLCSFDAPFTYKSETKNKPLTPWLTFVLDSIISTLITTSSLFAGDGVNNYGDGTVKQWL